ncbi:MAG TPA: LON peptidase substrate-binding domain-containing protein [Candidatus Limnocylindria bacterium]|jgi:Lon protease-like protein|nr:LON peptidase substrate-binding domain-containing protein [Candidatus Limnocylindria bacterium]
MEIPDRTGVMILGGCNLFPQALFPLFIFEPRYRTMLADSLDSHRMFCLAMQKPGVSRETPCQIAGLGLVRASVLNENGTSNLILQGLIRVRLGKAVQYKPYRKHLIEPLEIETPDSLVVDALVARVLELVEARLQLGTRLPLALLQQLAGGVVKDKLDVAACIRTLRKIEDAGALTDFVATMLLTDGLARQVILQTVDVEERLKHLVHFLVGEIARAEKSSPL